MYIPRFYLHHAKFQILFIDDVYCQRDTETILTVLTIVVFDFLLELAVASSSVGRGRLELSRIFGMCFAIWIQKGNKYISAKAAL